MTIDAGALPTPSRVEVEQHDNLQRYVAWRSGAPLRTRDVDAANRPRRWTLEYQRANGAVGAAIRQHFKQHNLSAFEWSPPGFDAVQVVHSEPPSIDWESSTTATVRVFLEEVLVHTAAPVIG